MRISRSRPCRRQPSAPCRRSRSRRQSCRLRRARPRRWMSWHSRSHAQATSAAYRSKAPVSFPFAAASSMCFRRRRSTRTAWNSGTMRLTQSPRLTSAVSAGWSSASACAVCRAWNPFRHWRRAVRQDWQRLFWHSPRPAGRSSTRICRLTLNGTQNVCARPVRCPQRTSICRSFIPKWRPRSTICPKMPSSSSRTRPVCATRCAISTRV